LSPATALGLFNFVFPFFELLDELSKGSKLFLVDKVELVDKVDKVLEAGV
jgi:hypothetical protein